MTSVRVSPPLAHSGQMRWPHLLNVAGARPPPPSLTQHQTKTAPALTWGFPPPSCGGSLTLSWRTTLECTYRTFTNANGCELCEYCVNECERARPHRANSVTGVRTGANSLRIWCDDGANSVRTAQIVCDRAKSVRIVCDRANNVRPCE